MAGTRDKQKQGKLSTTPAWRIYAGASISSTENRPVPNNSLARRIYAGVSTGAAQNHVPGPANDSKFEHMEPDPDSYAAVTTQRQNLSGRSNMLAWRMYARASLVPEQRHVAESANGSKMESDTRNKPKETTGTGSNTPAKRMLAGLFPGRHRSNDYPVEEGWKIYAAATPDKQSQPKAFDTETRRKYAGVSAGQVSADTPNKQIQAKPFDTQVRRMYVGASASSVSKHVSEPPAKGMKEPVSEADVGISNSAWQIRFLKPINSYEKESNKAFTDTSAGVSATNKQTQFLERAMSSKIEDEESSLEGMSNNDPSDLHDLEPEIMFNLAFRRGYLEARKKHLASTLAETKDNEQALPISLSGGCSSGSDEHLSLQPENGFRIGVESWIRANYALKLTSGVGKDR